VFLKSKKENIENSYNTYLIKYPNGKYIKEAYEAIELTVYSNAIKNNTLEAYNAYLNRYPKGKYSKQAGKSVEILYYLNSKSEETENAYKSYLNKYPSGKYSKKALAAIERIIFREAKNQFSKESFDVYIKRFPNGRYKIDIKEMLAGRTQVQTLINDLRDSDWIKQRDAAEKLGNIGDPRAVEPLLELLKADVFVASDEAAHALGKIANPGAVEPLIKELKSYRIGQNAATALGEIGDRRAINQLIATSNFSALGKIGDPRTTKILIDALTNKSSSDKREIIIALGDIEDPLAIDPLINILNRGDSQRSIVAEALVKIEASREIDSLVFINNLKDENIMVRRDAIKSLDSMRVIPVGDNAYYYYIVKSGKDYINKNWTVIKQLLLDNMIAGRYEDYSLRMFFWVGKNEVIPDLIDIMNNQHDTYMPELFLNCGQSQLSRAAKTWAKNHGYTIYSRSGSATRYWGQ
jgi:hypothetical protein